MPDPTTIVWGPLKIEKTEVTDSSVAQADSQKVTAVNVFDCFPPPGSVAEYVRPSSFSPEVLKQYLQDGEMSDLRAVHRQIGNSPDTDKATLGEIFSRLNFADMPIWYTGDKYREMRRITNCFRTTLYLRVEYKVFQIKVTANQQIQVGNKTFPAADEIATYRARQPDRFRFETHHEWNPRCCPERPEETPAGETTDWYTPFHSVLDDLEPLTPRRSSLDDYDWRLDPGYKWEIRPRLRIELKYDW